MNRLLPVFIMLIMGTHAYAEHYYGEYNEYDEEYIYNYNTISKNVTKPSTRDTYLGLRLHKNEQISFRYDMNTGTDITFRDNSLGLGVYVGNRLTRNVKIEFETAYTGAKQSKNNTDFGFNIWSNMLNVYLYHSFGSAVEPYIGMGIGLTGLWSDSTEQKISDSSLSMAVMAGINFALNDRIDLNLGLKYQYYGKIEHSIAENDFATIKMDATEFYIGAAYKFALIEIL